MKRFAVILIIAVLALGCVFAATSDTVVLETSVQEVIPCFEIYGSTTATKDVKGVSGISTDADVAKATAVVKASIDEDNDEVKLNVFVYEVGLKNEARKNFIRYKDDGLTVTIKADSLKNVNYLNGTVTSMKETGDVKTVSTPSAFSAVKQLDKEIHTVSIDSTTAKDTVTLTAKYTGEKVSVTDATTGLAVTDWTWTWDTSKLVAGETYRADITITYTVK